MIDLPVVLVVGGLLFAVGLYGVLSQTNTIMVIMGVELLLAASALNLVAFTRYSWPDNAEGSFFVLIVVTLMAIEGTVGFALVVSAWRSRKTAELDDMHDLEG
jgi:NAD(P)H-quinone oxidoreductase subunit 4L